jgi:hypothetical protein
MRTLPLVIYYNSICRVRNAHLTITDRYSPGRINSICRVRNAHLTITDRK